MHVLTLFGLVLPVVSLASDPSAASPRAGDCEAWGCQVGASAVRRAQAVDPADGGLSLIVMHSLARRSSAARRPLAQDRTHELMAKLSRTEKYGFVRGLAWTSRGGPQEGFNVGNANVMAVQGIPSLNMNDNGNGFRVLDKESSDKVTGWPCALAVASTWSEDLIENWGRALGKEFRSKGANVLLGPGLNVHRTPRGGRNAEYIPGESPYLGSRLAGPYVRGVQSQSVLAVMKHFVANGQETLRMSSSSDMSRRTLWEVYYPPFQAAIDAGVAAVMCGYNKVNGVYSCENEQILVKDLRDRMKFDGWVMSDWFASHSFSAAQGLDQEMPGGFGPTGTPLSLANYFTDSHLDTLSDAKLDSMVRPMLAKMITYGLLDNPVCAPPNCTAEREVLTATPAAKDFARELAAFSVLLLKNERQVLPFHGNGMRISVLGSACGQRPNLDRLMGDILQGSYYTIGGSGRVLGGEVVTILDGIRAKCEEVGCEVLAVGDDDVPAAARAAAAADVAVACAGATSSEFSDRDDLSVDQERFLVELAASVQNPLVTVTLTPGAIVMPWINDVDGALNLFFGGTETGHAIADVLFGDVNPAAKSPVTFPKAVADMTVPCQDVRCEYSEGLAVGWQGMDGIDVTFPFGHGLSYTTFEYSSLGLHVVVDRQTAGDLPGGCAQALVCMTVHITNSGNRSGVEVAQLYLGFPQEAGEPPKVLRGFMRTTPLAPGLAASVSFGLAKRDLQVFDETTEDWRLPEGAFAVWIGSSSRDLRLESHFVACKGEIIIGDSPCSSI